MRLVNAIALRAMKDVLSGSDEALGWLTSRECSELMLLTGVRFDVSVEDVRRAANRLRTGRRRRMQVARRSDARTWKE